MYVFKALSPSQPLQSIGVVEGRECSVVSHYDQLISVVCDGDNTDIKLFKQCTLLLVQPLTQGRPERLIKFYVINKSPYRMASRLAGWWRQSLKRRPVLTNTAVYATFYTAAELSQQTFNKIYSVEKPPVDLAAAARIVTVGSCLYAPTLYYWYKFLDKKFVGTSIKVVLTKVASDQFIATPVLLAAFYTLLGIMESKDDVFEELREKYWKTFVANQAFWIPGQTINFLFVPSSLRVVYVASASFIWINVLCFIKRQKSTEKKSN